MFPPVFQLYVFAWLAFCALAAGVAFHHRATLGPEWRRYLQFLLHVWWKVAGFVPAFLFVTLAGAFTDDETWDVISGGGMSALTLLTAPWALGTIYKVLRRERPFGYLIIAIALWLFSSSWFYDGYLLLRDGAYTQRWLGNLVLSPIIYLCAGLLWSLEPRSSWWSTFSFFRADWPTPPSDRRLGPILITAVPFVAVAIFVLVGFVGWQF